jgi:hypothetical protein
MVSPDGSGEDGVSDDRIHKTSQPPWRVFVSYSHDDTAKAEAVLKHLRSIDIEPMSDHVIPGGTRFSEEIEEVTGRQS